MKRKEGRHPNPTVRHRSILSQPTTPSTGATMKTNRHNNTYTHTDTHTQTHKGRHLSVFLSLSFWLAWNSRHSTRADRAGKEKEGKQEEEEEGGGGGGGGGRRRRGLTLERIHRGDRCETSHCSLEVRPSRPLNISLSLLPAPSPLPPYQLPSASTQ